LSVSRTALLLALVAVSACRDRAPTPKASPPTPTARGSGYNVLLVTIDTLRADHLGIYGYARATSPNIDGLAREGVVFSRAFTHWPKTRGSMAILLTGRRPSQNGYSKHHPGILGFNPTLASVLLEAGYETAALVDNPNVAADHGYSKGFGSYTQTWDDAALRTEWDRTRAITEGARSFLQRKRDRPFFLWIHYVNPHAPYSPPPPFDKAFDDERSRGGKALPVVSGFHGGIPKQWAIEGENRVAYYVAQYDGEIAAVDAEVGRLLEALRSSASGGKTIVLLTSDHGESLGEHGYFFDHGEDLFRPSLEIPFLIAGPGVPKGQRRDAFVSTLDVVPTILDSVKVSYPPDLAGASVLAPGSGASAEPRDRLFAQNDRNLSATWTRDYKLVQTPGQKRNDLALFDVERDPAESRDLAKTHGEALRVERRELELYFERTDREWNRIRPLLGQKSTVKLSPEACEKLKALGYVVAECQ
jgi:arylsulfatase A-like enzyme